MEDYKYLREIETLANGNGFIGYIIERVLDENYRGYQCSQHNRLTFKYFCCVIDAIYGNAENEIFNIHTGDDKGLLQSDAAMYYRIVEAVKAKTGKGTINSIKKNTFPDIARMGFFGQIR